MALASRNAHRDICQGECTILSGQSICSGHDRPLGEYNYWVQSTENLMRYAEVVVLVDANGMPQPLTYSVPDHLNVQVGDAVLVSVGAQPAVGYVFRTDASLPSDFNGQIKPIEGLVEGAAAFDEQLRDLALYVQEATLCELIDAVRLIAPDVLTSKIATTISLNPQWESNMVGTRPNPRFGLIIEALHGAGGTIDLGRLKRQIKSDTLTADLGTLRRKQAISRQFHVTRPEAKEKIVRRLELAIPREQAEAQHQVMETGRAKAQTQLLRQLIDAPLPIKIPPGGTASANALIERGLAQIVLCSERRNPFTPDSDAPLSARRLTEEQQSCVAHISQAIESQLGKTTLLFGVTGSGKTEVYLHATAAALKLGRSAIIALPEIGLTAQLLELFKGRFGDSTVAVLHSKLSPGERYDEWMRIKSGESRVVLGARSAVFAPIKNLGLIVLDEEHDGSYKQDVPPRYHTRDVAQTRARQTGAALVLGSATPSMESFWNASEGVYDLIRLPERIDNRPLPPVVIVDLRAELKRLPRRKDPNEPELIHSRMFGTALREAMRDRLERKEQTILFLNRRGYAPFLLCRDCGFTFRCPNCDVTLTYHSNAHQVRCHHCDYAEQVAETCPKCQSLKLRPIGDGTEKVEGAVIELFPEARTLRMDRDTMGKKGAHSDALRTFRRGEADILIGTQMVTKGLDFPNVTLVGVVMADTTLNIPSYRTAEEAFQILTQVAGRAGRGTRPGLVIVQTFTPEHPSIVKASEHDYESFYREEILNRQEIGYPPFRHMANFVFSDEQADLAWRRCVALAQRIQQGIDGQKASMEVLGPVPCPIERLRGKTRFHFIVRGADRTILTDICKSAISSMQQRDLIGFSLDIDPFTML